MPGIGLREPHVPHDPEVGPPPRALLLDAAGGVAAGGLVAWLLAGWSLQPMVLGAAIGAAMAVTILGTHGEERRRVLAIFLAAFFVVFFWAAYEQAGSSMNLFADKYTDLSLGGFEIPSSWFQSVNAVMILAFGPVFAALWVALARRGREPSTALKMVAGLALLGVGFMFLVAGGARADAGVKVSPLWLVLAYGFHTLGELCLSPVGLSYVSKIAPARFAALLMGAWYLANATANKLAGALAAYTPTPGEAPARLEEGLGGLVQRISQTNAGFFSIFVVMSLVAAAAMLLFVPLLKRLTASVKA
jgi:POT family proton-dependent oligopeptide transporter